MQSQMRRPYGHDQADEQAPELHGAPVYESFAVRGGVTGQPESLSHLGESNVPAPEEIIPPGTKVFPVVTSDYTKPIEPEPLPDVTSGHEPQSHPLGVSDMSDREESREAHYVPLNTPVSLLFAREDVTRTFVPGEDEYLGGQRKVNMDRPKGLEEDPAAPGGGSDYLSGVSNYQSKVTDPTKQGGGEAGIPQIAESLGRMKVTDESPDQKSGLGFERDSPMGLGSASIAGLGEDFPAKSHEFDQKTELGIGKNSPTGSHDQFSPELSPPKERDSKGEETRDKTQEPKSSMIGSATSVITDKAIAAKNAVASKLGYSGRAKHESPVVDETPRSATGYGQKVVGTVAEKLTPVYEKVRETGSTVMTKLPLSGGGSGAEETQQVQNKGASARGYLADKLRPGEEDKALSDVIAEKLHLGGEKKKTTTKEMEVTVEKIPSDELPKEEVKVKSPYSLEESSQSLGSTVGTKGFSDSGESGL